VEHITAFGNTGAETLRSLTQYFSSQGMDIIDAQNKALKAIEGMVMRQASMLSFNHVFFLIAALFFFFNTANIFNNRFRKRSKCEIINK